MLTVGKVAVLLSDQFEDAEYRIPVDAIRRSGWQVVVVGVRANETLAGRRGQEVVVTDVSVGEFLPEQFYGMLVPGGPSAAALAAHPHTVKMVQCFHLTGRPLAAIGDGLSVVLAAHIGKQCRLASHPDLREQLEALGAQWVDKSVAVEGHLITARATAGVREFAESFVHCLAAAEHVTSPREVPPETPPLD